MSPKERRAYALGYRFALRRARMEVRTLAANFDASVASVREEARKDLHAMAATFDAEVAALRNDFAEVVRDVHRYRAIERALDTERNVDARLH
jgi:hypothetical protein